MGHVRTTNTRTRFTEIASNSTLPVGTLPETAMVLGTRAVEFSGVGRMSVPTISPIPFEESLHDGDDSWMWAETALETSSHILADGIATNEATLITDGSYYRDLAPTKGGACWILETHGNSTHQAAGCLRSTGTTATAYRSELSGIYGGLRFVKKLCASTGVTSGSLRVGCDNLLAVQRCKGGLKVPTRVAHSDILICIRRLVYDLPITVTFFHVYGHQDNNVEYGELPRDAQLNVLCDLNAKAFL